MKYFTNLNFLTDITFWLIFFNCSLLAIFFFILYKIADKVYYWTYYYKYKYEDLVNLFLHIKKRFVKREQESFTNSINVMKSYKEFTEKTLEKIKEVNKSNKEQIDVSERKQNLLITNTINSINERFYKIDNEIKNLKKNLEENTVVKS